MTPLPNKGGRFPLRHATTEGYQGGEATAFGQLIHGVADYAFGNLLHGHYAWLGEVPREVLLDVSKIDERLPLSRTFVGDFQIGKALVAPHGDMRQENVREMYRRAIEPG